MARIKARPRSDGTVGYTVTWVLGGGRATAGRSEASETFNEEADAESFALKVEKAGHQWPRGWVKGQGFVAEIAARNVPTVQDVWTDYLTRQERRIKRGLIQADTLNDYAGLWRLHFEDVLGSRAFPEVIAQDVEDWVDTQIEKGARPKTVSNRHGLLSSVMKHGQERMNLRSSNPCSVTELPKDNTWDKRQVRFFQPGEWELMRRCLKPDVWDLVDTMLSTGMRWGEVSALWAGDFTFFDDDSLEIHIRRAWKKRAPTDPVPPDRTRFEAANAKLGLPKSGRDRRVIVTGELVHRLAQRVRGMGEEQFVFTTGGSRHFPWRREDFRSERWQPALRQAQKLGLIRSATPHMLRHTAVVWAVADGVPIEVVSEMLGHASIQVTWSVYGGLLNTRDSRMAEQMARRLVDVTTLPKLRVVAG